MRGFHVPSLPVGSPGLFGPGSLWWLVNRERALLLAGPAALLMQLSHPLVAAAIDQHMDRSRDVVQRVAATMGANLAVGFGDLAQARAAANRVRAIHERATGLLDAPVGPFPAGTPYAAADPELLLWVHATTVDAGLRAFETFVRPLPPPARDRYVEESRTFGEAFGLPPDRSPSQSTALASYVDDVLASGSLVVDALSRGLADEVLYPPVPATLRPSLSVIRLITAGLLPDLLRATYGLPWNARRQAAFAATTRWIRATVPLLPRRIRWWPHLRIGLDRAGAFQ